MKTILLTGICLSLAAAMTPLFGIGDLPDWSVRLGWTLVHSTWQLAAIAAVAFVVNLGLSGRSPNVRYFVSIAALAFTLIVPCVTWVLIVIPAPQPIPSSIVARAVLELEPTAPPTLLDPVQPDPFASVPVPDPEPPSPGNPLLSDGAPPIRVIAEPFDNPKPPVVEETSPDVASQSVPFAEQVRTAIRPWLGFIDLFWFLGVVLLAIRPIWGLWMQYRLRRIGLATVPPALQGQLKQLAERMGVTQAVRIAVSALVTVPMVVGYVRPMILLPASVVTGLTPSDLEGLLAHELAHIRRHDWIVNVLQVVVETVLFHHPAVWWLSSQIRLERELCCDDLALTLVQDKAKYGHMLLSLEELLHHAPVPALAATGGSLVHRVRRLLPNAKPPRRSFNGGFIALILLGLMGLAGGLSILSAQPAPAPIPADEVKKPAESTPDESPAPQDIDPALLVPRLIKPPMTPHAPEPEAEVPLATSGVVAVSSHSQEYRDPVIDLATMTINESNWYASFPVTRLYEDRWLRSRGYGDLTRDDEGKWIGFRGASLLVLDEKDLEEAAKLPPDQLKARISNEGSVQVPEESFITSKCLAILTGTGHLYAGKLHRPFPWSLKLDLRRLTNDADGYLERRDDGVDSASWGPVIDGLQAGIVYRMPNPRPDRRQMIGGLVAVKLFVRNASQEDKTYAWQIEDEFHHLDPEERAERTRPRLPIFKSWQPILVDAEGRRATVSPPPDHQHFIYHSATLKPGQAVFIGASATALWSAIDVDFGEADDQVNSAEVTPGEYRLSTVVDTGLIGGPRLVTGELKLQVVLTDPEEARNLAALEAITHVRRNSSYDHYWHDAPDTGDEAPNRRLSRRSPFSSDEQPTTARPLLGRAAPEYLMLPGIIYDDETKKPVAGAKITVQIQANSDHFSPSLCSYQLVTDNEGRYTVKVPRKLLSGYLKDYQGMIQMRVRHPDYSKGYGSSTVKNLKTLGLVARDGSILKQGQKPDAPKQSSNETDRDIQQIALRPARTISGRLIGPKGQTLPNVTIHGHELTTFGFPSAIVLEYTDSDGRFQFTVPAKQTIYLDFRTRELPDKEIKVTAAQTNLGEISAVQGMQIRGRVLDVSGKPVAHVSMTAPTVPREQGVPVTIFRTNEQGIFESDLLPPGEYQLEVGDIDNPEDRQQNVIRDSGPPPDLYIPYQFQVKMGVSLPDVTLKPAASTIITATLTSTATADDKLTDAFDVMMLKKALQKPVTLKVNGEDVQEKQPELQITADADTGKISVKGDPDNQWAIGFGFLCQMTENPFFIVKGTLDGKPWSAHTYTGPLFGEPDDTETKDPRAAESDPRQVSLKVPRELRDVTIETGYPLKHFQVDSGPRLFGESVRIPNFTGDRVKLKLFQYKATTLRIRLQDADGNLVDMKDNKLPEGVSIKGKLVREDEVRKARGVIESQENKSGESDVIQDNEMFLFVIPREEIEVTVTARGKDVVRRFTLKDGETRTAQLKLGPDPQWTETSKPTPKVEFEE